MLSRAQLKLQRINALTSRLPKRYWLAVVLVVCFLLSAHALIQVTHQSRKLHVRLQTLEGEKDALQVEWGRLLLEESSLVSPVRLEQLVRQQLNLNLPEAHNLHLKNLE